MYHGEKSAVYAESRYREVASGRLPDTIETVDINARQIGLIDLLVKIGFAGSNSDARRLIAGGGIKIGGNCVTDIFYKIHAPSEQVISRGKNRFIKIILAYTER